MAIFSSIIAMFVYQRVWGVTGKMVMFEFATWKIIWKKVVSYWGKGVYNSLGNRQARLPRFSRYSPWLPRSLLRAIFRLCPYSKNPIAVSTPASLRPKIIQLHFGMLSDPRKDLTTDILWWCTCRFRSNLYSRLTLVSLIWPTTHCQVMWFIIAKLAKITPITLGFMLMTEL
jgi:hypothetical protein